MPRTYLYKLTSDRGGAPCAPPPRTGPHGPELPLLSLSICKPAIRRTAQPGDRLLGLTSHALAHTDGYPLGAVIYAAIIYHALDAREYYAARSPFRHRPDCIYQFHRRNGTIEHAGRTPLHADPAYLARDLGQYPFYKNGRTLFSRDFRYFGAAAPPIPSRLTQLIHIAESLGQGHRVFEATDPLTPELDSLFRHLWKQKTRFTPGLVTGEAYGHKPRPQPAPNAAKPGCTPPGLAIRSKHNPRPQSCPARDR
jgi:hypothetical protein